jgi:hypothetical protein
MSMVDNSTSIQLDGNRLALPIGGDIDPAVAVHVPEGIRPSAPDP